MPALRGDQGVAEGGLAHGADDRGGDLLVPGILRGAEQVGIRTTQAVEQQAKLKTRAADSS
jgi:hypothetical protein